MGIIIALCVNWFAAGVCCALFLAMLIGKDYGKAAFNATLCGFNVVLGIANINKLIAAVQFIAETTK